MRFKEFILVKENINSLIFNSDNNNKYFDEVLQDFLKNGGELLGAGKYGQVLYHPSWKYVLKMFPNDDCYLRFIRYVMKNPSPYLPKLYDKPRKITPNYKRTAKEYTVYIVKTEKLLPITKEEWDAIHAAIFQGITTETHRKYLQNHINRIEKENEEYYAYEREHGREPQKEPKSNFEKSLEQSQAIIEKYPFLHEFYIEYKKIEQTLEGCAADVHQNNFMKREDGTFVIIDPLWEGSNPYAEADHQARMEMDYDGGEYNTPPEYFPGGHKHVKKRVKKKKAIVQPKPEEPVPDDEDAYPF